MDIVKQRRNFHSTYTKEAMMISLKCQLGQIID